MCEVQDSPQAALSFAATTAQEQFTNWYLQFQNNPPYIFDLAYNFVNNFSAAANAVRARPRWKRVLVLLRLCGMLYLRRCHQGAVSGHRGQLSWCQMEA